MNYPHLPRRAIFLYWARVFVRPASHALLLLTIGSLTTVAAPQLTPQDADMIAQRLQRNENINWTAAGVVLAVIVTASGLLMRHVNGAVAQAKVDAIDRAEEKFITLLTRRDEDRERFQEQESKTGEAQEKALRAELVRECMREVNGKYITRAETQAQLARAEERYTQTQQTLGKIEERLSKYGHDLNNLTALMEAVKLRLPKQLS